MKFGIYYSITTDTGWPYIEIKAKSAEEAVAILKASRPDIKEILRVFEVKNN